MTVCLYDSHFDRIVLCVCVCVCVCVLEPNTAHLDGPVFSQYLRVGHNCLPPPVRPIDSRCHILLLTMFLNGSCDSLVSTVTGALDGVVIA